MLHKSIHEDEAPFASRTLAPGTTSLRPQAAPRSVHTNQCGSLSVYKRIDTGRHNAKFAAD